MKSILVLLVLVVAVSCSKPALKPLSDEMVDYVSKVSTTWKAEKN